MIIVGKVGEKAFFDGIEGLVPCTVLAIMANTVKVKMRAKDGVRSWHRMDHYGNWNTEEEFSHRLIVPEEAVRIPIGLYEIHPRILPYKWEI